MSPGRSLTRTSPRIRPNKEGSDNVKWIEDHRSFGGGTPLLRALFQLGMDRDDVSVEVIERAKSGFLGFGGNPRQGPGEL